MITVYCVYSPKDGGEVIALFRKAEDMAAYLATRADLKSDLWSIPAETFEFEE